MSFEGSVLHNLQNFLRPDLAEQDLAREINSHLDELLPDEFQKRGMNAEEARLAAKRSYGGIEQAKELHRETRSWGSLEQVRQDVRISVRALRKSPGFSITVVLTRALGIGANAAIFSLTDAVMLRALPGSHPEQLLQVSMARKGLWGIESPFLSNPLTSWRQRPDSCPCAGLRISTPSRLCAKSSWPSPSLRARPLLIPYGLLMSS